METKQPTSMSKSEMAAAYNIKLSLLKTWVVELFKVMSHEEYTKQRVFTPKQVQKIYQELGQPEN